MSGSSKKYQLDKKDFWSILVVALLIGLSSALTYILDHINELDFGDYNIFIAPIIGAAIASLLRWLKDFTKEGDKQ